MTDVYGKEISCKMNRPRRPTTFVSFLGHNNIGIFTMTCNSEHGKSLNIDWTFAVLPKGTTLGCIKASSVRSLTTSQRMVHVSSSFFSEPFCRETPEELCGHTVYLFWQGWVYRIYDVNTLSTFLRMRLDLTLEFLLKLSVNNYYISMCLPRAKFVMSNK